MNKSLAIILLLCLEDPVLWGKGHILLQICARYRSAFTEWPAAESMVPGEMEQGCWQLIREGAVEE